MSILLEFIHLIVRLTMTLLILRFWLQWAGVNFYNPVAEMLVRFSQPLTKILRNIVPRSRRYDWASLLAALLLAIGMFIIFFAASSASFSRIETIFIGSLGLVLDVMLNTLFFTLIIRAIASWVAVNGNNPALDLISQLTDPLLVPIRRIVPASGGLDFSPMVLMLLVWFAMRILQQYFLF